MPSPVPPPAANPPGPETPWLVARSAVDLCPPLRLIWVLRIAAAPLWLATTAAAMLLCELPSVWLSPPTAADPAAVNAMVAATGSMSWIESAIAMSVGRHGVLSTPTDWWLDGRWRDGWRLGLSVWGILIWTPLTMALMRAGANLVASGPMPSWRLTWQLVGRRLGLAYLIAAAPAAVLILPALMTLVASWSTITIPLAAIGALIIAATAYVARAAVPFSLAALVTEPEPDVIDCLSRGTEALLRRLWVVALCAVVGIVILVLLNAAAGQVSTLAISFLSQSTGGNVEIGRSVWPIELLWHAWLANVAVALIGGTYTIASCSATGREIDATWAGLQSTPLDLPSVTANNSDAASS